MGVAIVPLSSSNMNNSNHLSTSRSMTDKPTDNDVLLGRGVATNRHPGNEHFRAIVSQHVDVYVISTKKQKTSISRSIVSKVNNELSGRFLEKNSKTGLWHEVDIKRALEKTAQALRDGAAPIRKQLSEDMSDPGFLEAVFDGDQGTNKATAENKAASTQSVKKTSKKRTNKAASQASRTKKQRTLAADHAISSAQEEYFVPSSMPGLPPVTSQQQHQQLYSSFAPPSNYHQPLQMNHHNTSTFDILNDYTPIPLHLSYATTTDSRQHPSLEMPASMEALFTPSAVEPTLSYQHPYNNVTSTTVPSLPEQMPPLVPTHQPQQYKHRRSLTNEDFLLAAGLAGDDGSETGSLLYDNDHQY